MKPAFDLTLYLVVGSDVIQGRPLDEVVAAAVRGGATLVQLREKAFGDAELVEAARALKSRLAPLGVPLIVNDRVEAAQAAGADGVHLGQDDLDAGRAREILGPDGLIGVSAGTAEEAARVDRGLADYVGIGSVYATATKPDAGPPIGVAGLAALAATLAPLPVVAIGGIGAGNAAQVMAAQFMAGRSAADGIAVVSAICGARDPEAAARTLRREIDAGREGAAVRSS
ncbi:MAG: thiamine phosphate synthase [Proteobacteria bacterium]|nr:thiamine phosphate synthase [Pseudomonadota bacterium]